MKFGLLIFLSFIVFHPTQAQNRTEVFNLIVPGEKVANSNYNAIRVIDKRIDTTSYGIIQQGAFNRKAKLVTETPLEQQLSSILDSIVDETAKDGELVLLLRQYNLAEVTGAVSEKGYCYLRAVLFGSFDGDNYVRLADADTVVSVGGLDVTKRILRQGSKTLTDFVTDNLKVVSLRSDAYTIENIASLDSIEKSSIALYSTETYKDGAYKSFDDFAKQEPVEDELLIEFWKTGNVKSVQLKNKKGKFTEVDLSEWYAFIYKNKLYISTEFGVHQLEKKDNDFFFTGRARTTASAGQVVAAQMFFGIIGGLMASSGSVGLFEMKIDHLTGGFIFLRELKR